MPPTKKARPPSHFQWLTYPPQKVCHLIPGKGEEIWRNKSHCNIKPVWNAWMVPDPSMKKCSACQSRYDAEVRYLEYQQQRKNELRDLQKRQKKRKFRKSYYTRGVISMLKQYGPTNTRQLAEMLSIDGHTILESCYYLRDIGFITLVSPATRGPSGIPAVYKISESVPWETINNSL